MNEQNPWQCLTVADLASVEAPAFVLQAGLTPTWSRWREGHYAEREGVFTSLWKAFGEWRAGLVEPESSSGRYLPVFWIEGRPGDGKSTLLLELMAACLREGLVPDVLWLEHSPDGRSFRAKPPAQIGWRFCAEVPGRAEGPVRDSWLAALREAGASVLITAGSGEARHGFEFRFESQTKVTKWVLPPFSPAEAAAFAQWYQSRAGVSCDAAALWRDGMSLAEFLLALRHGKPLVELRSDIRGALGNLGLGERVRAVWLVNALGLRAPGTLLESEAGRNHAAKLAERGLVPVEVGAEGLRLAPPAVAWPLVGTWVGQGHERQHLADALAFGLKAWLEANDEENAVRFLRQLRETEWLIDDKPFGHGNSFVQVKRTEVIRELYRLHRRDFGERPASATIPAWLELNEAFSLMLLPDPVVCATELFSKPEGESRRTPSLAALLWLAADNRRPPVGDNARKAVADYFLTPANGPSAGRALMRMVRDTKKLAEARTLAEAWLKRLPGHPEAVDALGALAKRAGGTDEFMAWAAERFLQPNPSHPGAPKLLAAMLEGRLHDETLRRRAAAWAWSHALEPDTGLVWHTLLSSKLAKEDVVRGALRWLAAHPQHRQADALRERLLEHYPEVPGAGWVMQEWLPNHANAEAAPDILFRLLAAQPNSRKASAAALKWLNQSLTHPDAPKLLRVLARHPDSALEAAAERWCDANPDSASHAELLSVFIHVSRGGARWVARGESYAGQAQRPGREHVAAALLVAGGCRLRDVRLALRLLPELAVGPRTFLETALGRSLARHPRQAEQAFRQFVGSPQVSDLAHALPRGLAQMADTREAFVQHVLPAMDEEARFQTLYRLVRADVRSAEIVSVLLAWLRDHHRQRGYTPLLGALHNHPAVWKCLLATGRVDRRVVTDFRNYRSEPGERIEETGPPA